MPFQLRLAPHTELESPSPIGRPVTPAPSTAKALALLATKAGQKSASPAPPRPTSARVLHHRQPIEALTLPHRPSARPFLHRRAAAREGPSMRRPAVQARRRETNRLVRSGGSLSMLLLHATARARALLPPFALVLRAGRGIFQSFTDHPNRCNWRLPVRRKIKLNVLISE
jgi:hypothetical protein